MSEIRIFASKESIRSKRIFNEALYVPQWDMYVNVKKWSGKQRANLLVKISELYGGNLDGQTEIHLNSKDLPMLMEMTREVVAQSICDELGELLFDINDPEDVKFLDEIEGNVLQFLFDESAKLNGLLATALPLEIKNLETTQNSSFI